MRRNFASRARCARGGGHGEVGDAERGEGVEDRVHHCRRRSDRAAFAGRSLGDHIAAMRRYWNAVADLL
jgi:hypothetical protein